MITQKMSENGEIFTAGQKFYTAAGSDGRDKSHFWVERSHMILNLIDWLKALNEL